MTLAIHGKSRRRQGILVLAAFIAVLGAIVAGGIATAAPAAAATTEPVEGDNSIIICKIYEQSGPADDFGRSFDFSLYVDEPPLGNADSIVDFSITVDEGQSNCTDAFQVPANATIGVQEIGSPGFTNAPGYPKYQLIQYGQEQAAAQDTIFFFNNENDCQLETPCVVNFFNRADDGPAEFPIRICKTLVDNGDGYTRPDTTFTFDANWTQTTITVAEGETECVVVYTEPEPVGNTVTVSEYMLPGFEQAPGFMKRKIDSYPAQSTPDMGEHAGAIILKMDDGCYEPYVPIEGGSLALVREVMSVVLEETTEPFMCTVYFFNQEVPNDGPDCEVDCEPECEVDCTEPECEIDCDEPQCEPTCNEPQCETNCDPPVCLFENCDPPCTPNCGEPQCEANCDDTTPTPTPTPDIPETPTAPSQPQTQPEPEEEVEGESTPGPQATPKAPDTGSSFATPSRSSAPMFLVLSLALVAASLAAGALGLASRRS